MAERGEEGKQGKLNGNVPPMEETPVRRAAWEAARTYATVALGNLVSAVTRPAYRKRSPAGALLLSDWERVVGPRLAADTAPHRLNRGVLTIACGGPVAMELQHLSATLIERINTHAGEALVTQLRFLQMPVAPQLAVPRAWHREKAALPMLPDLPEGELNEALSRLLATIREYERSA